jgi:hypothetical protein
MSVSIKTTSNTPQIAVKVNQAASLFLRLMADQIEVLSRPNTPKKKGFLRRDVLKQVLGLKAKIAWQKNYAARQETTQFKNYTTPGTGPHYAENAVHEAIGLTTEVARKAKLI